VETAARWHELAEAWASLGRPYRVALARWHEAEAADVADDRDDAVAALRAAYDIAERLGAKPLLGRLETMARRLRTRLGDGDRSAGGSRGAYGLTKREREVLAEVATGRTNREIAGALFISESTAGVHVSNILGKLGVSTRTEAARVALDQGLVGGDD
jgi:DNA-binding NarL/FixJ family response regulator